MQGRLASTGWGGELRCRMYHERKKQGIGKGVVQEEFQGNRLLSVIHKSHKMLSVLGAVVETNEEAQFRD